MLSSRSKRFATIPRYWWRSELARLVVAPLLDAFPEEVGELVVLVLGKECFHFGADHVFRSCLAEVLPRDLVQPGGGGAL